MSYDPYGRQRPPQPNSSYPYQPPAQTAPVPPQRTAGWAWAVLAVVLVLAGGVGYWVYDTRIRTDSGLDACKTIRDGGKIGGTKASSDNETMTEDQYRKLRKVFQDSRYDDIKAAGTKLMDVVWQVSQLGPDPGLEALPYLGQLTSAVTDIQGACANHGVIVNLNLGATPKPTTTS
jgi:uncharacterized protein HemX